MTGVTISRVILIILLAAASRNSVAEWIEVESSADGSITVHFDSSSINRAGDMAEMWDLGDFKTAMDSGTGTQFMSIKGQSEYNCKNQQYRTLYSSYFSGNMGKGVIIGAYPDPQKWMPVLPGSLHESLYQFACGQRQEVMNFSAAIA